jgi:hypothetical protein
MIPFGEVRLVYADCVSPYAPRPGLDGMGSAVLLVAGYGGLFLLVVFILPGGALFDVIFAVALYGILAVAVTARVHVLVKISRITTEAAERIEKVFSNGYVSLGIFLVEPLREDGRAPDVRKSLITDRPPSGFDDPA